MDLFLKSIGWKGFALIIFIAGLCFSIILKMSPAEKERERAQHEARLKILGNLKGKTLYVIARQRDGKKTTLEAHLVDALLRSGAVVRHLNEADYRRVSSWETGIIQTDTYALIGWWWLADRPGPSFDNCFDFRLTSAFGNILASGALKADSEHELAEAVVFRVAGAFPSA